MTLRTDGQRKTRSSEIKKKKKKKKKKEERTCLIANFTVPVDHRVKLKEITKRDKYRNFARELKKKLWIMKVTVIPRVISALSTVTKELVQGLEDLKIRGRVETIQTKSIIEIGQNTEKSPGDLRRLAVTQTPVRKHRLTMVWKTRKGIIIIK